MFSSGRNGYIIKFINASINRGKPKKQTTPHYPIIEAVKIKIVSLIVVILAGVAKY